ncbi:hypothetical protein VN97_g12477 [Penicillium thymicola]|uniref:Uncharacterized protein n=1 Tax=Penicillium thymicola TaxID=293382 RepID=A0AAI9X2J4_PENTH|nr:hypothetical protein VN97_g12477 [Penicillium thymicola]
MGVSPPRFSMPSERPTHLFAKSRAGLPNRVFSGEYRPTYYLCSQGTPRPSILAILRRAFVLASIRDFLR